MTTVAPNRRPRPPHPYVEPDTSSQEFQAVRQVLEGHPVVAALPWDERNSLAQGVLDVLAPWLLDNPDEEGSQSKALAEARQKILVLEFALAKARKAAAKSGSAA